MPKKSGSSLKPGRSMGACVKASVHAKKRAWLMARFSLVTQLFSNPSTSSTAAYAHEL